MMRTGFGFDGIWGCEEVFGPKTSLNGGDGSQKKAKTPLERRECADRSTESLLKSFEEGVVRTKLLGKAGAAGALATAPSDIAFLVILLEVRWLARSTCPHTTCHTPFVDVPH